MQPIPWFSRWRLKALLMLLSGTLSTSLAIADIVVIVNLNGPDSMTREQVSDLFLGRASTFPDGVVAVTQDLPESSPLRNEFYIRVTGKSAAQAKSYWSKMVFTGKGVAPREGNSSEVKRAVADKPGGIGYIERSAVDGSIKPVLIIN